MPMKSTLLAAAAASVLLLSGALSAGATTLTLSDLNSQVLVDPDSAAGMHAWTVDGASQLKQQWFWYRIGPAGPERALNELAAANVLANTGDYAKVEYAAADLIVQVRYGLTGGTADSQWSDIAETIRLINPTSRGLEVHFFQYNDYDLEGTPDGDTVRMTLNMTRQTGDTFVVSENVVAPTPSHFEAAPAGLTLARLTDDLPTTLNDFAGPLTGDVTWAYQWDFLIPAGGTAIISKDKLIDPVPEPTTLVSMTLGLAAVASRLRRRSREG